MTLTTTICISGIPNWFTGILPLISG